MNEKTTATTTAAKPRRQRAKLIDGKYPPPPYEQACMQARAEWDADVDDVRARFPDARRFIELRATELSGERPAASPPILRGVDGGGAPTPVSIAVPFKGEGGTIETRTIRVPRPVPATGAGPAGPISIDFDKLPPDARATLDAVAAGLAAQGVKLDDPADAFLWMLDQYRAACPTDRK